jgi:hypothetical protein
MLVSDAAQPNAQAQQRGASRDCCSALFGRAGGHGREATGFLGSSSDLLGFCWRTWTAGYWVSSSSGRIEAPGWACGKVRRGYPLLALLHI